jgi:predicted N-acyltransferase
MATSTGTVTCVQVGDDFGFTTLQVTPTTKETFILWTGTTTEPPVRTRIVQSDWIALLRQALADNLTVVVNHQDGSAIATAVQLGELT